MPYLILDPTEEYAALQKRFLDRLGLAAVALFSNRGRLAQWEHRWRAELGENVIGEHLVDPDDLDGLAETLRAEHPGGFFGLVAWDERHILLAADISEALELDWNSREVIERFRDKAELKAWLRRHSAVRINASRVVGTADDALDFQEQVGTWPIVVKPSGGAGSMAVHFAGDPAELLRACQEVLESGLGEVLLEEYIGGEEFAVNGIVDHAGEVLVTDIWRYDRRDSHGERNVYFHTWSVHTDEEPFAALAEYATAVIRGCELRRSPFHMEVKVDDVGPSLIECGARFAGGNQPVLASRLQHHSIFELAACHYLDDVAVSPLDVDYEHYDSYRACIVSGVQEKELPRVEAVLGVADVERLESFEGIGMLRRPGMRVGVSRDVTSKAWEIYLFHADDRQIEADAAAARRFLRYV